MNLLDLVARQPIPEPWSEGEKIPWNDPEFSQRMLHEHLSQAHDLASRRTDRIDRHVAWIHNTILDQQASRILDLGCGPGLYATRLARLGHTVTGIDFAPSSIVYARQQAADARLACRFIQSDIRRADVGTDAFEMAMLIFGEFNVFHPDDAQAILRKVQAALTDDGLLILEVHTPDAVRHTGQSPSSWHSSDAGLFSDRPHLLLIENFWLSERQIAIERYFVIDAEDANVTRHAAAMQSYSEEQIQVLLQACGFHDMGIYPSLHGETDTAQADFFVVTARKKK